MFFERTARHLEHVSEFARHQIAYAEATGDLTPGELTSDEAVDEVLLRAYREFDAAWDERRLRARLAELARETIAAAAKRSRAWHRRTPARIETDIPDVPPSEWVTTLGEERLEFYEPEALGKTPPETHRLLDHARHDLRQRLLEAGCRFKAGNGRDPGG